MTDTPDTAPEQVKKPSKLPLIVGVVLALLGAAGGFYVMYSGLLFSGDPHAEDHSAEVENHDDVVMGLPDVGFVPIDPLIISLPTGSTSKHLRFHAELEVYSQYKQDVEMLMPRIVDVMNSYLRALEVGDIEKPNALVHLRAQLLRRIQIVIGPGRVRDLLIMEYVLN